MKELPFSTIAWKTIVVHTVTYFIIGFLSFTLFDYRNNFADPIVANSLRQTDHPLVSAGPLFQVLRGFLFGIVFYALRKTIFPNKSGWLTAWVIFLVVGIFSPFSASPGSIEGMIYSTLPLWFHILSLPELIVQSFLLAFLVYYWVNHPEKKWLGWIFTIIFVIVVFLSTMGLLAALGLLPSPTGSYR